MKHAPAHHWLDFGVFLSTALVYWTLIRTVQLVITYIALSQVIVTGSTQLDVWRKLAIGLIVVAVLAGLFLALRRPWFWLYRLAREVSGLRGKLQRIYLRIWAIFALVVPTTLAVSVITIAQGSRI